MADLDDLMGELDGLVTECVDAGYADLDLLSADAQVDAMIEQNEDVLAALRAAKPDIVAGLAAVTTALRAGGRLIYVGAGTPGRLGVLDASEIPPTFGEPPTLVRGLIAGGPSAVTTAVEGAEDDEALAVADLRELGVTAQDCVVGISASGRTPYVVAAVAEARRLGAHTVGVSCNAGAALSHAADVAIELIVGPEIVGGSTRLKAGTAQKIVLNTLSTLAMVDRGKTYGPYMVDLRATNEKLRARAVRTVAEAAGVSREDATRALRATAWAVKPAILICMTGASADEARAMLDAADGRLRRALEDPR